MKEFKKTLQLQSESITAKCEIVVTIDYNKRNYIQKVEGYVDGELEYINESIISESQLFYNIENIEKSIAFNFSKKKSLSPLEKKLVENGFKEQTTKI
jgi:hypothetical protein